MCWRWRRFNSSEQSIGGPSRCTKAYYYYTTSAAVGKYRWRIRATGRSMLFFYGNIPCCLIVSPGRPPVAGLSDAQNVRSVVAKDGNQTKCQELRVLCTLRRRVRDCCSCTDKVWSRNIRHTCMPAASIHCCMAAAVLMLVRGSVVGSRDVQNSAALWRRMEVKKSQM